jgi:hypothetical protein
MPLLETHVDFTDNFAQITRDLNELARRCVQAGAQEGGAVARAIASQRSKTGRMAAIQVLPAERTFDGWIASFVSPAPEAWFQNYGTLGNRRKPLKQAPRTNRTREPGTGITPLRFLDTGRRVGRAAMLRVIDSGL